MAIKIVTDSTSYILNEYVDKYDIKIVSLNVVMDGVSRREVDIDSIVGIFLSSKMSGTY